MKKKKDYALLIGVLVFLVLLLGSFFVITLIEANMSEEKLEFIRNQTTVNISNAYIEGALYTYQTGKVVVPEQTINGIQLSEYPIEEICNNLNKTGGN